MYPKEITSKSYHICIEEMYHIGIRWIGRQKKIQMEKSKVFIVIQYQKVWFLHPHIYKVSIELMESNSAITGYRAQNIAEESFHS
jgi:hypothetical protein